MQKVVEKKKVLIISYGLEIGGIERSLIGLLDFFDYTNYQVDLFLYYHQGEFMNMVNPNANLLPCNKEMQFMKQSILAVFKNGYYRLGMIRLWAKLVAGVISVLFHKPGSMMSRAYRMADKYFLDIDKRYDIALGFFGPYDYLLNHINAAKKVGWVHTDYTKEQVDINYELKNWEQLNYISAVSLECRNSFISVFPSLAGKVLVIENILDVQFIREQANAFDVKSEIPNNGPVRICSVGRFCEAKAFDEAALACRKLIDIGYLINWYIIGYGPDESLLRRIIKENHLGNYFIILGKKENPYPYMKACDIYAQPSRYEGKAVTVREAQILGKPVLITNFPTAKSQLENGVDGHICEMGINGIVEGLKLLIDNSDFRENLARTAMRNDYGNQQEINKIYELII